MDTIKKAAITAGAIAVLGGGGVAADQAQNPYTDDGTSYRMEVAADIPQDDHIEIAKDSPAMTLSRWNDEARITITPEIPLTASREAENGAKLTADRPSYRKGCNSRPGT